jgi:hypothetical protein
MKIEGNDLEDSTVTVYIAIRYPVNDRCRNEEARGRKQQNRIRDTLILTLEPNFCAEKNWIDFSKLFNINDLIGGPDGDRTDDIFHAIVPTLRISTTYKTPVAP